MCVEAATATERDGAFAVLEGVEGVHTNVLIGLMSVVRLCAADAAADAGIGEYQPPWLAAVFHRLFICIPHLLKHLCST